MRSPLIRRYERDREESFDYDSSFATQQTNLRSDGGSIVHVLMDTCILSSVLRNE